MSTYSTIDGRVLDLSALSDEQRRYFDRCVAAYREGMTWADFTNILVSGAENPLLRGTSGWITRAVWEHPLFQAVHDLGDRLGIAQGMLAPEGDPESDPLAWRPNPRRQAAARKPATSPGAGD